MKPVKRATTQAIREQIYHGYELPLARARGGARVWGKYEEDRPWTHEAAARYLSGDLKRGQRLLNRDHVWEAAGIVGELLGQQRNPQETADFLDQRLVTCTVLASEHAALGRVPGAVVGWDRYRFAGINWHETLSC